MKGSVPIYTHRNWALLRQCWPYASWDTNDIVPLWIGPEGVEKDEVVAKLYRVSPYLGKLIAERCNGDGCIIFRKAFKEAPAKRFTHGQ